jgi:hypothetical protein
MVDWKAFLEKHGEEIVRQVGVGRLIAYLPKKELVKQIGIDDILAHLSPAERRELKRRLQ